MCVSIAPSDKLTAGVATPDATASNNSSAGVSHQDTNPNNNSLAQLDGPTDHQQQVLNASRNNNYLPPTIPPAHIQHQAHRMTSRQAPPRQQPCAPTNIVADLLPYCTTEPPLTQEQVIALTDVVGNMKELVVLALGAAAGEADCVQRLGNAVGSRAAANIAEFFADEWEIEG